MGVSEGELFIIDYFKEKEIKFKAEYKISSLKNDTKSFRMADFYLPNYKVYVEFFGQWNLPDQKERYKEKIRVYKDNKIPVIYIFPENLGVFDYLFRKRLLKVLQEKKMKRQLLRYMLVHFRDKFFNALGLFLLGLIVIIFSVMDHDMRDRLIFSVGSTVLLASILLFVRAIVMTFRIK